MKISSELKLIGDEFCGGYSCGLTMHDSATMRNFTLTEGSEKFEEGIAAYENGEGLLLIVNKAKDGDALRIKTTITNNSDKEVTMEMLTSFCLSEINADRVHRLQSFWSSEGRLKSETIEEMNMEPSWMHWGVRVEKFGSVGSMPVRKYFPFLALEDSKTGEFVGMQLYLASTWQMEIICREDEKLTVTGGIGDRDFGHWMKTLSIGETFEAPEAVIARGDSLYDVCDKLVKAQHPDISPVDSDMGIIFNEYCATWGDPTFEKVKNVADKIEGRGIKYLVIDSGWYIDPETHWWDFLGDWDVNEKRFPGGLKPIGDYVRSKGMIPGVWFEMDAITSGSKHFNETEHILKKDGMPLTVGGRRFWDMEDKWVKSFLEEKVIKLLKESNFGYVKIDHNEPYGIGCDGAESLGEGLRRKIVATQEFFAKMKEEIPDLVIENCSAGGHRLEPSMMKLCSMASFSDAHETTAIPLIAANLHRVIRPEQSQIWAVLRAADSKERIEYSLAATFFGRMCLSGDIYDLTDEQWAVVDEGIEFYKKAADIIKNGKTIVHRVESTSYNNPKGQQLLIRKYENKRLAILHRFEDSKKWIPEFPKGCKILAEFGSGETDFSAKAWIYETNE